ncbi:hypothetical protein [Burkholderia stabilis]|uniref:hypothetical protein n=1 Tax=Burkholderia stabilis TaxID=95485 RepID=UPI001147A090|nr:hypothetical protein [Burkholderia stabilis]
MTMATQVIFTDLGSADAAKRLTLEGRQSELNQVAQQRALMPQELAELARITQWLSKVEPPLFDPLYIAIASYNTTSDPVHGLDFSALPIQPAMQADGTNAFGMEAGSPAGDPASYPDDGVQMAAVYGYLSADSVQPPAVLLTEITPSQLAKMVPNAASPRGLPPILSHLTDPSRILGIDTSDPVYRAFSEAYFKAMGEFNGCKALATLVFPILVTIGATNGSFEVDATEYAQVLRILIGRGIDEHEPQLTRKVNEALDAVQNVANGGPTSQISIDLPDLEASTNTEIIADNIRAMQPAYFSAMFEELKVFQVVDKLAELFQNGVLPIGRGKAGDYLYAYWKNTPNRISEAERRSFYARTLGVPGGDDGGSPNRDFNDLWLRFVSAVSSYVRQQRVDDLLRARIPNPVSQQLVRKSGRDIANNLSVHGYGMAYFIATELQQLIKDFIGLLSDPDILLSYGAKDMWGVIDQVATLELGGAKNSVKYRTMATSGAIVMAWLAKNTVKLGRSGYDVILDDNAIRFPVPRPAGVSAMVSPTDYDLVNACDQWLAVTGTEETRIDQYAQAHEAPMTTTRPIQIPSIARDLLDSVGVPAMSLGTGYRH